MPDNGRGSEAPRESQAPESFEAFAQASQRRLYRTAYLLCGDPDTARDLTQTTLAKLFQHWQRASAADHSEAYARTVLTRTYLAERRRRLRDLLAHFRPDPRPAHDDTDLRVTLISALAGLPPRARAMVVLRYWEDQSVESVAELLKCSESTVKSQCSRSLAKRITSEPRAPRDARYVRGRGPSSAGQAHPVPHPPHCQAKTKLDEWDRPE